MQKNNKITKKKLKFKWKLKNKTENFKIKTISNTKITLGKMSELLLATIRSNVKESRQGKTYKSISHFEKPSKMELLLVKHLLTK